MQTDDAATPSTSSGANAPVQITEDEAAVYDRQIRLWGLEAQQRMRNARIAVINLKGVATETIKNIVLAGIGTLVVVDAGAVAAEDLGAGFFFRDEDVGQKRVLAAKSRIESLNPLVTVEAMDRLKLEKETLDALVMSVDLVCVTDSDKATLIRINDVCRRFKKPFYAGGSYGLFGYIFCDLLEHEYIAPERGSKDPSKHVKTTLSYSSLQDALQPFSWSKLSRMQTKNLNPAVYFALRAIWDFQEKHNGMLPHSEEHAAELKSIASVLFAGADVNKKVLTSIPDELIESISTTAAHEFSPVCAILGGILAQDILKALAAKEPPLANFFVFDGNVGHGSVVRMHM